MTFSIHDQEAYNPDLAFGDDVEVNKGEALVYRVTVESDALYHIGVDLTLNDSFSTPPTLMLEIDDDLPFNEVASHAMDVSWEVIERTGEARTDRFGNELLPRTESILGTYHERFRDSNGRYDEPYWFYLEAGTHTIRFTPLNTDLTFGDITLSGQAERITYDTYDERVSDIPRSEHSILIEGEDLTVKNDVEIKPGYYKGALVSPSAYRRTVLNVLDGESTSRSGTAATYRFEIPEHARYRINLKILQNEMIGMSSARRISIDGEVLFDELSTYLFPYTKGWTNHTLGHE
ncbi:MAG: hypothetical protein ACLFTZ_06580, partial [Acholeplasmataceae bacterium]